MKRIIVYEAEPGDWRWMEAEFMLYYVPVTEAEYAELVELEKTRLRYNALLKSLEAREVEGDA